MVAYNLPGICIILGVEEFKKELLTSLVSLSKDESITVRSKVAISIHEICKAFAAQESV